MNFYKFFISLIIGLLFQHHAIAQGSRIDNGAENSTVNSQVIPQAIPIPLHVNFIYPAQLTAGEPFHLIAEIKNLSEAILEKLVVLSSQPFSSIGGSHSKSFQTQRCLRDCVLLGTLPLTPNETLFFDLGTYFYSAEMLFSGDFSLHGLDIAAFDSFNRFYEGVVITSQTITIDIHSPGGTIPNSAYEDSPSLAIEIRNLFTEDDELLVHDYNTGYDWLKFSVTEGLSVEEVSQLLVANNTYSGFQIATANQVEVFIANYLRGEGIRLLPHQIFVHSDEINDGLKDLGSLLGGEGYTLLTYGSNGGIAFHRQFVGIVRDTPTESDSNPDRKSVVYFSAFYPDESNGALSSSVPSIVERGSRLVSEPNEKQLYWLFRSNKPGIFIPASSARYINDELVLPSVKVGDKQYALKLNFRNRVSSLMQLVSAKIVEAQENVGTFNFETNLLDAPRVLLPVDYQSNEYYQLKLEFIKGTNPPLLLVKDIKQIP